MGTRAEAAREESMMREWWLEETAVYMYSVSSLLLLLIFIKGSLIRKSDIEKVLIKERNLSIYIER